MQTSAAKPLILMGIPTNGEHSFHFTQSLLGAIMPTNYSMALRFLPYQEVGHARNILVQEARNLGATYIFFRDEDTIGPANLLPALLYHLETKPELTFVGGLYATKSYPPEPLVYTEWGAGPDWGWKQGEFIPVLFTGMGAALIRIADLDALDADEYEALNPWHSMPMMVRKLFMTGSEAHITRGGIENSGHTEDAYFFDKLQKAGLKAAVDTNLLCGHWDKHSRTLFYPPMDNGTATRPDPWNRSPRVVNLGAGGEYNPYELQVDLRGGENINFRADIRKLPDDWADAFDVAKAHHVLEHFDFRASAEVLREWLRILKPGGRLEIVVPDLEAVIEAMSAGRFDALVQGNIYGDQGHPFWNQPSYGGYDGPRFLPHSTQHNHHNSGYTARFLIDLLKDIGFINVRGERRISRWELYVEGEKPGSENAIGNSELPGKENVDETE